MSFQKKQDYSAKSLLYEKDNLCYLNSAGKTKPVKEKDDMLLIANVSNEPITSVVSPISQRVKREKEYSVAFGAAGNTVTGSGGKQDHFQFPPRDPVETTIEPMTM